MLLQFCKVKLLFKFNFLQGQNLSKVNTSALKLTAKCFWFEMFAVRLD